MIVRLRFTARLFFMLNQGAHRNYPDFGQKMTKTIIGGPSFFYLRQYVNHVDRAIPMSSDPPVIMTLKWLWYQVVSLCKPAKH